MQSLFALLLTVSMLTLSERDTLEHEASSPEPLVAATALYRLAVADDEALLFAAALKRYEASVATLPSFRYAPRARARAELLRAHAEGDFGPYAELERVRRDPGRSNDPKELEALARAADSFPPGLCRVEARMLVATAYMGRLHRAPDAIPLLQKIVDDEKSDSITAREARKSLFDLALARGDYAAAKAAAGPDTELSAAYRQRIRRHYLHLASIVTLVFFVSTVALAFLRRPKDRSLRAALAPFLRIALPFVAWTALAGGALAATYETGNAKPFLLFGLALAPIAILARFWSAVGSSSKEARAARAVLSAATVFGAAFLVLEHIDVTYLESFGL